MVKFDKTIAFLCVFMGLMTPYNMFGSPLPLWIGLIATLLNLTVHTRIELPRTYFWMFIYMVTVPIAVTLIGGMPTDLMMSLFPKTWILFTLMMLLLNSSLRWDIVLRYYRYAVLFVVAFFFVQEISYYLTGHRPVLALNLPFLQYRTEDIGISRTAHLAVRAIADRSSSIFLEPAHFVQYILPYAAIVTCRALHKKIVDFDFFFVISALILSRSGCGYVCMAVILVYFLLTEDMHFTKKLMLVGFVVGLFYVAVSLFRESSIVSYALVRLSEISPDVESAGGAQSGFLRIFRGYMIFDSLPLVNKFFGVASGSMDYISSLVSIDDLEYSGSYMNGFQSMLCRGGIVGTILFFSFVFWMFRNSCTESRYILVAMVTLMFVEWFLCDAKMFTFVMIAYCMNNNEKYETGIYNIEGGYSSLSSGTDTD